MLVAFLAVLVAIAVGRFACLAYPYHDVVVRLMDVMDACCCEMMWMRADDLMVDDEVEVNDAWM